MRFEFSQDAKDWFIAAAVTAERGRYVFAGELALRAVPDRTKFMAVEFYQEQDRWDIAIVCLNETVPRYVVRIEPDGDGYYTVSTLDPWGWYIGLY